LPEIEMDEQTLSKLIEKLELVLKSLKERVEA